MPTYKCRKCNAVRKFAASYVYELKDVTCDNCKSVGNGWEEYRGEMWGHLLDEEDGESVRLESRIALLAESKKSQSQRLSAEQADLAKLEREYKAKTAVNAQDATTYTSAHSRIVDRIAEISERIAGFDVAIAELRDERDNLGVRNAVRRDASVVYGNAEGVEKSSGKNKLYIGSRQYVSSATVLKGSIKKKARILDAANWSPGLNVAWVEGGIKAKARFKLKMNSENQYFSIPRRIITELSARPDMDPEAFFELCRDMGRGSLLWYDRGGKDRPSWTALEIYYLLRSGYRFNVAGDGNAGEKIYLVPPV